MSDSEGSLHIEEHLPLEGQVVNDPTTLHSAEIGDPQGIQGDLHEMAKKPHDPQVLKILTKINNRDMDLKNRLETLDGHVGPQVRGVQIGIEYWVRIEFFIYVCM